MSATRRRSSQLIPLLVLAVLLGGVGSPGCSFWKASTCDDLQDLAAQIRDLGNVNLIAVGTDGLKEQLDAIEKSWKKVLSSSGRQFGRELRRLQIAVDALLVTLRGKGPSSGSLGGAITKVEAEVTEVTEAWKALVAAVSSELSDCDLS